MNNALCTFFNGTSELAAGVFNSSKMAPLLPSVAERFSENISSPVACWLWQNCSGLLKLSCDSTQVGCSGLGVDETTSFENQLCPSDSGAFLSFSLVGIVSAATVLGLICCCCATHNEEKYDFSHSK